MKYPIPCCRCGFCCLSEACPVARVVYSIEKSDKCPALSFEGDQATCVLAMMVPTGDGCCIKARAYKDGVKYDFASLPVALKQAAARTLRERVNGTNSNSRRNRR